MPQGVNSNPQHHTTLMPSLYPKPYILSWACTAVQAAKADLAAQLKAAREEATLLGLLWDSGHERCPLNPEP